MDEQKKGSKALIWIAVVIILALIGYGGYRYLKQKNTTDTLSDSNDAVATTTTTNNDVQMEDGTVSDQKNKYKDGTYSVVGDYYSPGGAEQLGVTITLEDDVIVSADVVSKAFRPNSIHYQGLFISGYKPLVIGKKIDDVQLDKVSGSSLAPKGFMDALAKVEVQAKV